MEMLKLFVLLLSLTNAFGFFNLLKTKPIDTSSPSSTTPEPITSRVNRVHEGIRGVSPHDLSRYRSEVFKCDSNRKQLDTSVINDGYCDCEDGSDEPGTSACNKGTFKCLNKGYKIIPITSSRVDDGICDCCDGSDEGVMTPHCPNTCNAFAEKERATLDRIATSYRKGVEVRNKYIDDATITYSNAMSSVKSVQSEQQSLQTKLDSLHVVLEKEVALEKVEESAGLIALNTQIDDQLSLSTIHTSQLSNLINVLCVYYDITQKEIIQYVDNIMEIDTHLIKNPKLHAIDVKKHIDIEHHLYLTPIELSRCVELTSSNIILKYICNYVRMRDGVIDTNYNLIDLSKYVLKELIRDKGAYISTQYALIGILTGRGLTIPDENDFTQKLIFNTADVLDYMKTHEDYDINKCLVEFPSETFLCSLSDSLKNLYKNGYGSKYQLNRLETTLVRNEIKQIELDIKRLREKVVEYNKYIELYGKHSDYIPFVSLNEECVESGDGGKFIYTLCMLKDIKQKEVNGHNTVNLGSFESFEQRNDGAIVMHFDKGTHCHAHGARKADVVVTCGVENILKEPREPSTCFYTFELESPAACTHKYAELNGIA